MTTTVKKPKKPRKVRATSATKSASAKVKSKKAVSAAPAATKKSKKPVAAKPSKPAAKARPKKNNPRGEARGEAATSRKSGTGGPATARGDAPEIAHELLLSAVPHPVFLLGPDNKFLYSNSAGEVFLSTSLVMLKRQRLDDIVSFGCPLLGLVEQVRETGSTVNEYGVEIVTPRFSGVQLVDVYGGPMHDVSRHTVLMLQQRSMALMIERQLTHRASARSVSGMAAILAHEIKNPLSGIRGAAQLLEPALSDEDRSLTQLICSETERIRELVDRMEVFGDERPLTLDPINIHDVLDHVIQLAQNGFGSNVSISEDYDPSLPPVSGNRDKLIQAFLNLIKNAVEAIGGKPDRSGRVVVRTAFRPGVRLSLRGADKRIALPMMIEIEDNGSGIADHIRAHLFDPFVTTKMSGTGLGLALVAKMVADHGGVVECDSAPMKTIFRVLLPLQEPVPVRKSPVRKADER